MKHFKLVLVFAIALFSLAGCATQGPWHGKVIDAETKEPIEGAVVVAVFTKSSFSVGGPVENFYDAMETLTDKEGNWEIPVYKFTSIPLTREVNMPEFTIFKPGYGSYPHYQVSPKYHPYDLFLKQGAVVELPKLTDRNEREKSLMSVTSLTGEARKKAPKFFELFNVECRNVGIPELR